VTSATRTLTGLLLVLFFPQILGCEAKQERFALSGEVQLNGKPVPDCMMVLQGLEAQGASESAVIQITGGKFAIEKEKGLLAGKYSAVFSEIQPDLEDYEANRVAGAKSGLNKKFLPPKYTTTNDLQIQIGAESQSIRLELTGR
jgi:hypothetical protein